MRIASRLLFLAAFIPVVGYAGYLAIVLGPSLGDLDWADLLRGYHRTLWPAEVRGPVLRSQRGGADRVYVLTTQQERIVPLRFGRIGQMNARQMLHVDLWAFDPKTAKPEWRRRLRTYEDRGDLRHEILGADGGTLWLFVREPLAVSLRDGVLLADGAEIEEVNPPLRGKRVDEDGYVAFGAQGLQLTLSDSTQWVVDGDTLAAMPRSQAPRREDRISPTAYDASSTQPFQQRGLPLDGMWLGVLTDAEAEKLKSPPVIPGRDPGERPGIMADFLAEQNVPGNLDLGVAPVPYRLWSAKVEKVSAAPRDWPKELPDRWGTRDKFSDYRPLPDSPPFLQAGLLGDGRSPRPFWFRQPDSVVVLHHDKVGSAGRLHLARVSGPGGKIVWNAPLLVADLRASTFGESSLAFLGILPNLAHDPQSEISVEEHALVLGLDVASGAVAGYDLSAESVADTTPATPASESDSPGP